MQQSHYGSCFWRLNSWLNHYMRLAPRHMSSTLPADRLHQESVSTNWVSSWRDWSYGDSICQTNFNYQKISLYTNPSINSCIQTTRWQNQYMLPIISSITWQMVLILAVKYRCLLHGPRCCEYRVYILHVHPEKIRRCMYVFVISVRTRAELQLATTFRSAIPWPRLKRSTAVDGFNYKK